MKRIGMRKNDASRLRPTRQTKGSVDPAVQHPLSQRVAVGDGGAGLSLDSDGRVGDLSAIGGSDVAMAQGSTQSPRSLGAIDTGHFSKGGGSS